MTTIPLFPQPDPARLRARRISANALCGPSCPELEWPTGRGYIRCSLFGTTLREGDGRAVRCKACIQETGKP